MVCKPTVSIKYQFSNDWNIGVNPDKTKIVVLGHAGRMAEKSSGLQTKSMMRLIIVSLV